MTANLMENILKEKIKLKYFEQELFVEFVCTKLRTLAEYLQVVPPEVMSNMIEKASLMVIAKFKSVLKPYAEV